MALNVNLVGDAKQDLASLNGEFQLRGITAEINAPITAETPVVVCVSGSKGVTSALIAQFSWAKGQQVRLAAVLYTGGKVESELVELLDLELFGVLAVFVGKSATDGLRKLRQWKEGWGIKLAKALGKPKEAAQIREPEKSAMKKHGVMSLFK
jgi:hypothetical protein